MLDELVFLGLDSGAAPIARTAAETSRRSFGARVLNPVRIWAARRQARAEAHAGDQEGRGQGSAEGKVKVKGGKGAPPPPAKGKGGKGAPPPPAAEGKGGKGKGGPPGKGGKGVAPGKGAGGKAAGVKLPLGRRFHWDALSAEEVRGTMFEEDSAQGGCKDPSLLLPVLQLLFNADGNGMGRRRSSSSIDYSDTQVQVFREDRARHIAIVFRKVFGTSATVREIEVFSNNLMALNLEVHNVEDLELLATALPQADEVEGLKKADVESLRQIERLVLPLIYVPRAEELLRCLKLEKQAGELQRRPLERINTLVKASCAMRESMALKQLVRAVARLGSWINTSQIEAPKGFTLSSALGKVNQFRALRVDRDLSLLHVVLLSASDGHISKVQSLAGQLTEELRGLSDVTREDLVELGQTVADLRSKANWIAAQADAPKSPDGYTEEAQARLRSIHEVEFVGRVSELNDTWDDAVAQIKAMLAFFGERWTSTGKPSFETAGENLYRIVNGFRNEVRKAAKEIVTQPKRFEKLCPEIVAPVPEKVTKALNRVDIWSRIEEQSTVDSIDQISDVSSDDEASSVESESITPRGFTETISFMYDQAFCEPETIDFMYDQAFNFANDRASCADDAKGCCELEGGKLPGQEAQPTEAPHPRDRLARSGFGVEAPTLQ